MSARRAPPGLPPAHGAAAATIVAVAAAAIGVWTFSGALQYGFSQYDFLGLARATGHAPRLHVGWRWLSHQAYWDAVAGPLRDSARAAHALSIALNGGIAALLAWMLSRRLPAAAALAGAAFVASHPSAFTAVYWAAANGDLLAALFSLAALAFAFSSRARWLAVPCFALALLGKESALPLPVAWLAIAATWPRPPAAARRPIRDPVWWACIGVGVAFAVRAALGAHGPAVGGEAYALSARALPANVLSYDGWLVNRWLGTMEHFIDAPDRSVYAWGIALNLAWAAGAFVPGLRRNGWIAAGLGWTIMLAPVLLLAHHTYHYYMVTAVPAAGLLVAALFATITARAPRAAGWAICAGFALFCAADGRAVVRKIEQAPFKQPGMRADAIVDRALIASRAIAGLREAGLPPHTHIRMWSPQSRSMGLAEGVAPGADSYYETNVRAALLDGLALKVMVPAIDSVEFVRAFSPAATGEWWAVYRYDGGLKAVPAGELARLLQAGPPGQ